MNAKTAKTGSMTMRVLVAAIVALVALACFVPAGQAEAKVMTLENAEGTVDLYPQMYGSDGSVYMYYTLYSSAETDKEPTGVRSSKKSVCEASAGYGSLDVSFSKTGTSKVSYKWKGKKHTVKFVMHKWTSPVKSFLVGGNQYANKFKSGNTAQISSKILTGKVKITPKDGWKVSRIEGVKANYNSISVKNGKTTLKKSKKIKALSVHFQNKKSGQDIWIDLDTKGFSIPF